MDVAYITALSALFLIAALWGWLRPQPPRQTVRYVLPFDSSQTLNGSVSRIALSPDGKTLVFAGGPDAKLFVRQRNELTAAALPGTDGASAPFFSPDGQWVGFFASGKLKKVALTGGNPIALCDSNFLHGASWGPDDTIIFSPFDSGLFRVPAGGGDADSTDD